MDNRKIICTNNSGSEIIFGSIFSPFLLCEVDGIYSVKNNVTVSENNLIDGAIYQGSTISKRNIVLTVVDKDNHQTHRTSLYKCFKPKTKGTLKYYENNNTKKIDYYVESIEINGTGEVRKATISLICPDPFFYDEYESVKYMAEWNGSFEFPHEFTSLKEEFGYRSLVKIQNIINNTEEIDIGLKFKITSSGDVKNIKLFHLEENKSIEIGTADKPFNMKSGDILEINTTRGNKQIFFTTGGVTKTINNYLSENSSFFQLGQGDNHIAFDAQEGVSNMSIEIRYAFKYDGV